MVSSTISPRPHGPAWYQPITSPEHGVYIMLLVSFLTGAAAAHDWTWMTSLALLAAYCGFQTEHPLVLQIKQRKSWKPRFLVWAGLYGTVAGAIALLLYLEQGAGPSPLLGIYAIAATALVVDGFSVLNREQKSVANELVTFTAVCLAAPFAYVATTGTLNPAVLGLWVLNTLFFSSAIFTVKLRKNRAHPRLPGLVYHGVATLIVLGLWVSGWLSPITALAFSVALVKFGLILWRQNWYCTTKIQFVAMLETGAALVFLAIAALSLLPPML